VVLDDTPGPLVELEQYDVLDDLRRFADIRRMADFNISKRIVPTVEIRRQDDLIVASFGSVVGPGGAGTFSQFQIFNNTLDRVMRLRKISIATGGTTEVAFRFTQTDLNAGGPFAQSFDDTRKENFSGNLLAKLNAATPGAALAADQMWHTFVLAASPYELPDAVVSQVVLAPGWGLTVGTQVANLSLVWAVCYQSESLKPTRIPNG